jgi:hypothetical protein
MALKDKERQRMKDAMLVAGTVRAAKEIYDVTAPIVKAGIKKGKTYIKNRKKRRDYETNSYKEGE